MSETLSWDDVRTLSVLAAEKGDDRTLSDDERGRWVDMAVRIHDSLTTRSDLRAAAQLAALDAELQRDAKVRQRYLDTAERALAAAARLR